MCKGVCGGRWAAVGDSSALCHTCYEWLTVITKNKVTLRQIEVVGRRTYLLSPTGRSVAVGLLAVGAHGYGMLHVRLAARLLVAT